MPHPGLIDAQDVRTFLDAVRAGDTQTNAAKKAGWSLVQLRRKLDRDDDLAKEFADARQTGALARADTVDQRFDEWIDDPKCAPALRIVWAKRWHPGYREKIEVSGAYVAPQGVKQSEWQLDMAKVAAVLAEAGVKIGLTIEPAEGADGPSDDVPGPGLLPAPAD